MSSSNLLDCTFRDGGYYNNWEFRLNLVKSYLKICYQLNISYIEIGFRSFNNNHGVTGYTPLNFLKKLPKYKDQKLGVMINANEIIDNKIFSEKKFSYLVSELASHVYFVRIACHLYEVPIIKKAINLLVDLGIKPIINIMQISEINELQIKSTCEILKKQNLKTLYLADSLGCMSPKRIKSLVDKFKKYWPYDLGVHLHNNLKQALKSCKILYNSNKIQWIDFTMLGMGRGAGNLATEDYIKYIQKNNKNYKRLSFFLKKNFAVLKKKYKWGPNKYYSYAAINKIHPTYIQEILSNKNYSKYNYYKILNYIKTTKSKVYNPYNLYNFNYFNNKSYKKYDNIEKLKKKYTSAIIVGPSSISKKTKNYIESVNRDKTIILVLNTSDNIHNSAIDYRLVCHPQRIISDLIYHKKNKHNLIIPLSYINQRKELSKMFSKKNRKIINYGLHILVGKKIIRANKSFCTLPEPLAILYGLSVLKAMKIKKIEIAGLYGYDIDNPYRDNTEKFLKIYKKINPIIKLKILGKTKYQL